MDKTIQQTIDLLLAEEIALKESLATAVQKAEIRLAQIRAAREALVALESDEPTVFEGKMAEAIRMALRANVGRSLSPLEVRDRLKALGYPLNRHDNEMAAIHGVLKRLEDSKEIKGKNAKDGTGRRYFWPIDLIGTPEAPSPTPRPPTPVRTSGYSFDKTKKEGD